MLRQLRHTPLNPVFIEVDQVIAPLYGGLRVGRQALLVLEERQGGSGRSPTLNAEFDANISGSSPIPPRIYRGR